MKDGEFRFRSKVSVGDRSARTRGKDSMNANFHQVKAPPGASVISGHGSLSFSQLRLRPDRNTRGRRGNHAARSLHSPVHRRKPVSRGAGALEHREHERGYDIADAAVDPGREGA